MSLRAPMVLVALAVLVRATAAATVSDWPQFRGPDAQGHAVDASPPVEWGPEKNVAWKVEVPGRGWSSPVVVTGRVFLTAAVQEGGALSLRALALDAQDGKSLWNVEIAREQTKSLPGIHSKNGHASPTPLVHGERLFVHFGHLGTACLDRDGKILWTNRTLRYPPRHGAGGSPALIDDLLVFSCDGEESPFLVALSAATGEVKWRRSRSVDAKKKFSFSTPLLVDAPGSKEIGGREIVSVGSEMVAGYEPKSGEELWRVRFDGYSVVPRPVVGHGLVFFSTGYDDAQLWAVKPGGKGDVTSTHVAWTLKRGAPNNPSPLLVGDELYLVADRGIASCVDARTGTIHWQERLDGTFSASPILAGGNIYLVSEDGVGFVLKPGKEFLERGRSSLGERTLASPAAVGNALYIRTESRLWKFEQK